MTEKFTPKKCMTQCVTLCMTQNLGATLLKIGVYDTKMYDTKCKTINMMQIDLLRSIPFQILSRLMPSLADS